MEKLYDNIEIVDVFSALADKTRLSIARELLSGEKACSDIIVKYNLSKSTFSHHAKVLAKCGLVRFRREGKFLYFSLNKQLLESSFSIFMGGD